MINTCDVCKIEFETKKTARTCSPKCRVTLNRSRVTLGQNVTLPVTPETFEFTIKQRPGSTEGDSSREAKYWYDVPLAAIPIIKEGWPDVPEFMNGRQYFLWWKNNFGKNDKGEPVILRP